MAGGLADGFDDVRAGPSRADYRQFGPEAAAAAVHHVTGRASRRPEKQGLTAPGIAGRVRNRLLHRAEIRDDLPDFFFGELVGRHRRARYAGADGCGELRVPTAVAPRAGRQVGAAHPATRGDAMAEHAFLTEQHGPLRHRFRIARVWITCRFDARRRSDLRIKSDREGEGGSEGSPQRNAVHAHIPPSAGERPCVRDRAGREAASLPPSVSR